MIVENSITEEEFPIEISQMNSSFVESGQLKERIQEHYDKLSPFYNDLWGQHIHHGYWITGNETKEEAQIQLIKELSSRCNLKSKMKILDVGCGLGGTSMYLAKEFDCVVTGITISSTQVEMANKISKDRQLNTQCTFLLMDAEKMTFPENSFDLVWISEALSHFPQKKLFFQNSARILKQGGRIVIADWFKRDHLTEELNKKFIKPIEEGMLLPELCSVYQYISLLNENSFHLLFCEDVSAKVSKTWDICSDLLNPTYWKMALELGWDSINFLKAFGSMRKGFKSQNFVYSLIIAEKV